MESADIDALRLAIIRLSRNLRKSADRAGVTPSQTSVLFSLDRRGPLRLGDLARCEQVANPTVTRLVSALEARGLVERCSDESDARSSIIAISADGRALLAALADGSNDYLRERLNALPNRDVARIVDAIGALTTLADGS